jgi:hypothetical protein
VAEALDATRVRGSDKGSELVEPLGRRASVEALPPILFLKLGRSALHECVRTLSRSLFRRVFCSGSARRGSGGGSVGGAPLLFPLQVGDAFLYKIRHG